MTSYTAAKWKYKGPILVASMVPIVVGLAMLYVEGTSSHFRQPVALAGYYLLAFLFGGNPLIVSWMVANTAGQTKKSAVMSLYNCGSAVSNIVGPLLFGAKDKPHYSPGVRATLGVFCALMGVIVLQCLVLFSLNKVRQKQRVAHGKPKHIVDTSMTDKYHAYCAADGTLGQNALLDMTDFKDDEFVYVY